MNKQQIAWAKQHDWFYAERSQGVVAYEGETDSYIYFDDMSYLRAWAGY